MSDMGGSAVAVRGATGCRSSTTVADVLCTVVDSTVGRQHPYCFLESERSCALEDESFQGRNVYAW
jgi:hypothetical protein